MCGRKVSMFKQVFFKRAGSPYGTVELTAPGSCTKVPNGVVSIDLYNFYVLL